MTNEAGAPRAHIELRLRLPVLWLALLLAATVFLPDRVWNTLLIGLGGLFAVSYVWARQLAVGLSAHRRLRFGWVSVGDRLEEQFELNNTSFVPALWVEVVDESNVPGYRAAIVRSLGTDQVDRWRQSAICNRRGQFALGPWSIRSGDPFGIFVVSRRYPVSNEIIIHPPIHGQLPIPLPAGLSSGRARIRQRAWQKSINAASIRDYQPMDPLKWIHWPTSAHHNQLYVQQFDLDAAGDIWLLMDLRSSVQLGQEANSTEEQAVLLAASMAAKGLGQNRGVGLATYGREPQVVPPGRGQGQRWKILRALALVNADGETSLASALTDLSHIAGRGTAAVVITPDLAPDWLPQLLLLAQRGIRSHVILLDRQSFGGQGNGEGLQQAIRQLGFGCDVIRKGDIGQPPDDGERRGFWDFRVTATGRVIVVSSPLTDRAAS